MPKSRACYLAVRLAAYMALPVTGMIILELALTEVEVSWQSRLGHSAAVVEHSVLYVFGKAALGALPVVAMLIGVWLHTLADRMKVGLPDANRDSERNLNSILSSDEPFVLLIRSFGHDSSTPFAGYNEGMTFEMVLMAHLERVGCLVAIGRPGEALPPVGAVRLYCRDEEWQEQVKRLMAKASLIVIIMGDTHSVLWEVEQALESVTPDKLLLFPRLSSKSDSHTLAGGFAAVDGMLKRITGHSLPNSSGSDVLIWFDANRRPHIEGSPPDRPVFDRVKDALGRLPDDRRHLRSTLTKPAFRWRYGHFKSTLLSLVLFVGLAVLRVSYLYWSMQR